MHVTFDPAKNETNLRKHRIGLGRAADFDFDSALYVEDKSQPYGEIRLIAIGWIDAALYTLVFHPRGEEVRAISLRKSTREERELYAENA